MNISLSARYVLAAVSAALIASAVDVPAQEAAALPACMGEYVIGPEDVVEIAVWNNEKLTRTVPVRPDGKISLPLLDDVQAAGLTAMQLRDNLTKALVTYMPTPSVSVIVREIHSFKVTVIGQVREPGRYELKDRATVLDVLAMAGGLTEFASRGRIAVLRQEGGTTQRFRFPYESLGSEDGWTNGKNGKNGPGAAPNFCVRPGDIIFVP